MQVAHVIVSIVTFVIGMIIGFIIGNEKDEWGMPKW